MPKYVLALDTSHEVISLGLARFSGLSFAAAQPFGEDAPLEMIDQLVLPAFRAANSQLLVQVEELLKLNQVSKSDLLALVVARGPGSFTGVRIAIATAKGLSFGLRIPLYGVPTSLACGYSLQLRGTRGWVLLVSDALRKEIYPSLMYLDEYETGVVVSRLDTDFVVKPEAYLAKLEQQIKENAISELKLVGSGLEKYSELILAKLAELGVSVQLGEELEGYAQGDGLIATYAYAESQGFASGDPASVLPIYTRLSDAEETEREKLGLGLSSGEAFDPEVLAPQNFIRLLNPGDLSALTALADGSESDWQEKHFASEFEASNRSWFGLFENSELKAYIGLASMAGEMHVMDLFVEEASRKQGFARRLLERAEAEALERRCRELLLDVRVSNTPARALYEDLGFELIAERASYYPDGESAYVMRKELLSEAQSEELWGREAFEKRSESGARILALESSCDETALAVIEHGQIVSNVVASQIEFHARFGGVVPEIASRKHTEALIDVTTAALEQAQMPLSAIDALAVTDSPGLIGALVVGLAFAKGLSFASDNPLYGINHLESHLYANILENPEIELPFVALVISGGHTSLIASEEKGRYRTLGATLDDAAGEAFDKVAKALGLPYPGGPHISRLAKLGDPTAIDFPRAMMHSKDYSFSLSGLKTAVLMHIQKEERARRELNLPNIAASFQQAVIDVQVAKALSAMEEIGAKWFLLAGGVAANEELRLALQEAMSAKGYRFSVPRMAYCTDNAAMVAATATDRIRIDEPLGLDADAKASAPLDTL